MERFHVDHRLDRYAAAKDAGRTSEQLVLPSHDLRGLHMKAFGQFSERAFWRTAAKATFALKAGAWLRRGRFEVRDSSPDGKHVAGGAHRPRKPPYSETETTSLSDIRRPHFLVYLQGGSADTARVPLKIRPRLTALLESAARFRSTRGCRRPWRARSPPPRWRRRVPRRPSSCARVRSVS